MTSFRQIDANRRNARNSTGPITAEGKRSSRCNAIRHGLTAETVIGALEDAEDYKAFEAAMMAAQDPRIKISMNDGEADQARSPLPRLQCCPRAPLVVNRRAKLHAD